MDIRITEVLNRIREEFIDLSVSFSTLSEAFEQLHKRYIINPLCQESFSFSQDEESNGEEFQAKISSVDEDNEEEDEEDEDELGEGSRKKNKKYYTSILSKVYRVKLFNKSQSQNYAFRVFISLYNKSLCLGPYKSKELALWIRSKITRGLKKFHVKDCANPQKYFKDIIDYYQKMKAKLDKKFRPLEMKRNKRYYKYSNRKINN